MSSGKKRTVIKSTEVFIFVRQERPGKKTWFEIHLNNWQVGANSWEELEKLTKELDELFLVKGAKKKPMDRTWNFWKYEEADQLFTLANLKWIT